MFFLCNLGCRGNDYYVSRDSVDLFSKTQGRKWKVKRLRKHKNKQKSKQTNKIK